MIGAGRWLGLLLLLVVFQQSVRADCAQRQQQFNQAADDVDVQQIVGALQRFEDNGECGARELALARRASASRVFRVAYAGQQQGMADEQVRALMLQSEALARTWRNQSFLGQQDHQRGDYTAAARRLQQALALIDDPYLTPTAPASETIQALHQLAGESLMLAAQFVSPPQVRGVSSGVFASRVRGFSVRLAPLPISFKTASTDLTRQGLQALQALLVALRGQSEQSIEIVGHADERGEAALNMRLSLLRAQRVRDWLLEQGVPQQVLVSARGESQPMRLADPSVYTQEQIWQLNRRVELLRREGSSG